ncbi:hypothetical protein LTR94_035170, partial [Friedmanniomyces endolithicus]
TDAKDPDSKEHQRRGGYQPELCEHDPRLSADAAEVSGDSDISQNKMASPSHPKDERGRNGCVRKARSVGQP